MRSVDVKAYAKINLALDVTGKRPDGYHEVRMIMQMIDLYDCISITVEKAQAREIMLDPGRSDLPADERNLAYRAALRFMEAAGSNLRARLIIEKKIPVAAGLAGGSTDAAAVLLGLNFLCDSPLTMGELMRIGKSLGADVPFCLMANASAGKLIENAGNLSCCALAEGIGEILTPVILKKESQMNAAVEELWIVLTKPPIEVSTAKVYNMLDFRQIEARPDVDEMVRGLQENNLEKVIGNMVNVLENVTLKEYPVVMYTKNKMKETNAISVLMSGSGPSVFGLYKDKSSAEAAYEAMRDIWEETYLVRTI